jgi:hypothetical protein
MYEIGDLHSSRESGLVHVLKEQDSINRPLSFCLGEVFSGRSCVSRQTTWAEVLNIDPTTNRSL